MAYTGWAVGPRTGRARRPLGCAAFDARIGVTLAGEAAPGTLRRHREHDYQVIAEPEGRRGRTPPRIAAWKKAGTSALPAGVARPLPSRSCRSSVGARRVRALRVTRTVAPAGWRSHDAGQPGDDEGTSRRDPQPLAGCRSSVRSGPRRLP